MPNDEEEADRLDMAHELSLTIMDRKLFFAPVDPSAQHVLDLCTGTGLVCCVSLFSLHILLYHYLCICTFFSGMSWLTGRLLGRINSGQSILVRTTLYIIH